MTLTLDLTPEQEAKLKARAEAAGLPPEQFMTQLLEAAPATGPGLLPGETVLDAARRAGFADAFEFPPRSDGRAWSEVEGFD